MKKKNIIAYIIVFIIIVVFFIVVDMFWDAVYFTLGGTLYKDTYLSITHSSLMLVGFLCGYLYKSGDKKSREE